MATNQQPWFSPSPGKGMRDRVAAINRMRDPGTFADEILMSARFLFVLSLLFTGALCFFSYKFFLVRFLDPTVAIIAAAFITVVIEVGKGKIGMASLRMPFMQGWRWIFSTPENTGLFAGATLFAVVIFSISIYNSTTGAAKYAETTATQKTETAFTPDTKAIDSQIERLQQSVANAPTAVWKGRTYYQEPKAVRAAQKSIETLSKQRETVIQQQREDFLRNRNQSDSSNAHAGTIALRVGGWLELLQVILMFVRASCERVLARRNPTSMPAEERASGIGFQRQQMATAEGNLPQNNLYGPLREPIGFRRDNDIRQITVPQSTPPVTQPQTQRGYLTGQQADDALKYHLQRLQKEPSHLNRPDANPESVCRRIHNILEDMKTTLHGVENCSADVSDRIETYYFEKVQPALARAGYPYDHTELFTMLKNRATL